MLKLVDFFCNKEGINEGEISIGQISVIPHFLGHKERAQHEGSPIGGLKGHLSKCNQSVNVDQAYNAAFRTSNDYNKIMVPELSTIIEGLHKFKDIFYSWSLSQQGYSLSVKSFWLFHYIFLL